ncbi:hypothetical protein N0V83_005726 [Neocucurbitaria cava]|uniref:Uncharacterized protein n=1 Tax=Neocucurbitaria cava TaxID=798079 RepID=A0A9W8Y8D8_9PLEO|nr:hypothetical protein N0V83_005726 [Neocucurbitaria cava]
MHHKAVHAGTAKHSLAEQLPVLNWVVLGLVSAGAGLHLIRRYRKKNPQIPIPPSQDRKKWRVLARGITAWLQQAMRSNAALRRDLQKAQQAAEDMRRGKQVACKKAAGALQEAQDLRKTLEDKDEDARELRKALEKEQAKVLELRQHIQHAEELERMQDEEITVARECEEQLQQELRMETAHRKQLQQRLVARSRLPDRSLRERLTTHQLDESRPPKTPQQNYGSIYESVERILRRDAARVENTPTNPRKRGRQDGGGEEASRPRKLQRSSSSERGEDVAYTPKGTPPSCSYLEGDVKERVNPRIWGLDGLPAIKVGPTRPLQTPVGADNGMSEDAMGDDIVESIETPVPSYIARRARSRLPVPSSRESPVRRSARAATRGVKSLNEREMALRSMSPEKDKRK